MSSVDQFYVEHHVSLCGKVLENTGVTDFTREVPTYQYNVNTNLVQTDHGYLEVSCQMVNLYRKLL